MYTKIETKKGEWKQYAEINVVKIRYSGIVKKIERDNKPEASIQ